MTNNNNLPSLMAQYISVWIWSIQFGALTGLTYTYIAYNPRESWGIYTLTLAALNGVGILTSLFAWIFNYRYLLNYLIPRFVLKKDDEEMLFHSAFLLKRAFYFLMMATTFRLMVVVIEKLLPVL